MLNFRTLLRPVPESARFTDKGFYVWGGSMVRDASGTCHLFYSRWPRDTGFQGWVTHSEIARAVSDDPLGPYRFADVALPARDGEFWDGHCTHNPTAHKFGERYYLYYMGNRGDMKTESMCDQLNWTHRNNQRIGIAVSDRPEGDWERLDKPIVDISKDSQAADALCVSNPSITETPDGKFFLIYKCVARKHPLPFGGPVSHKLAIADSPAGEFKKTGGELFTDARVDFPAEDPFIWYCPDDSLYYAIVKDMKGSFTGCGTSLAFFYSKDGLDWNPADTPLASERKINWIGGEQKVSRLERPQIWFADGKPRVMFAAALDFDRNSFNVHIPLSESN